MRGLRIAVSFLTRIPVGIRVVEPSELARGVAWFPVVGALVGGICALVYAGAIEWWSPAIAATLAITTGLLVTGAFHEDGLADTVDAFGGGKDRDDAVRILKDPSLGTFGVTALIVTLVLRVVTIATFDAGTALVALPALGALSRAAALIVLVWAGPAGEGLGTAYAGASTSRHVLIATSGALIVGGVLLGTDILLVLPGFVLAILLITRVARVKLGGATGDVLGATQQISEVLGLVALAATP